MPRIVERAVPEAAARRLRAAGVHPVLARVLAARGLESPAQLVTDLPRLAPLDALAHVDDAARVLADAIRDGKRIVIVADYDADGATACAAGVRALRALGAEVDYLVPNRFEYGYGLTPEIVRLAHATKRPDVLVTVDNGIASVEGVDAANALGMAVVVTDHHLPGPELPRAAVIVNPNQAGCGFPSKHLAGVGVMFYVVLALRAELRRRGAFAGREEPNFGRLLDLVALGTVADVVRLDDNNRILVHQGLKRIREGRAQAGVQALFAAAGRDARRASTYDLGFCLGPRLNAAGRMADMALGIECLVTDDPERALAIAGDLDRLNRERRAVESEMQDDALAHLEDIDVGSRYSLALYRPGWHQGVIGILAARIRERYHRPVIAFAAGADGELKGSGRSIGGLHLRDALDLVVKRHPGLVLRFGGHAAAAGLSIPAAGFDAFRDAFEDVVGGLLTPADLEQWLETDGAVGARHLDLDLAREIARGVWGQGFPEPLFEDSFEVAAQRVVGERHLKLQLARDGSRVEAMLFFHAEPLPGRIRALYRLDVNEFNGAERLQLTLRHWEAL